MTKYIHTSPATDWFFVHSSPPVVHRLALWAIRSDGTTTGLIPVSDPDMKDQTTARLAGPPPLPGHYKHLASLDAEELKRVGTF